ncbi:formate dehydrogenase accessory sulfurtransferase FdhD [Evansella sp. AB-rgal1]|uniref:formate dehydrogenase accessory sulfurtransferase FdhD n=1 Tax=Evansella sp. AB-rgal1 TaxID=3242696 RepID=UPI00359D07E2
MKNKVMQTHVIKKYEQGVLQDADDLIVLEEPLTITVNGHEFGTMLCTPADLEELVLGFLASEGVIRRADEVDSVLIDEGKGFAYVVLKNKQGFDPEGAFSKRVIGSCCGKSRQFYFQSDVRGARTILRAPSISAKQCCHLMSTMQEQAEDFKQTGGLHNASLASVDGILVTRSDIGRHNALDKLFGYCLRNNVSLKNKVIVFSGRISSEVLLKVSKIGVGIIIAKSAPTTLAIELARDLEITLVGFVRGDRFNVYSRGDRVVG